MNDTASNHEKVFCDILKKQISVDRCDPSPRDFRCKACSQYKREKKPNRWDYVKEHLQYLSDGGHHNMQRWSILVNSEIFEALFKSELDFEDLQESGILEIQTISEWEGLYRLTEGMFKLESKIYREQFNEGDETAIFEFCRNHHFAFRSNWVVSQIEKWKLESSKESISKLKKIFSAYTDARGKTLYGKLLDLLKEDKEICDEVAELKQKMEMSIDSACKNVAQKRKKAFKTVKEIFFGYKDNETYVLNDDYLKQVRGVLIRVKYLPAGGESYPDFIDPAIDKLFFQSDKIETEYEIYKKMRYSYQGAIFQSNPSSLRRLRMDKKPFKILSKVIEELANEITISVDKLVDIYKTFRSLEILRNDDNDKDERWIKTEDIINSELSV